ncbi:putative hydrolase of HD superfamily [Herbaspirillum sp. Sphag1AN]|nr:putative hydrolase of HD superfamily [Herbaspirillum sp. Sphag1AN]MBB3245959.1 putative hydrolase of HD superfamily [Herbaspirillum sp. Sphag64]
MTWWADDCKYYVFPSTLVADGIAAICERHIERFKESNLYGSLHNRIVVGNMMVDYETVTRTFPEGPGEIEVICIYEVERNKIVNAWFKQGERKLHA